MSTKPIKTFQEFWPVYLAEHRQPMTRTFHFIGSTVSLALFIGAIASQSWSWLVTVPLAGYGFAWTSHMWIEKNRPLTFTYPLWSLASDYKMWWLMLTGRLVIPQASDIER